MISQPEFDDLVGAYALDACSPEEVAAVDEFVDANPTAARELERLRTAAVWMAATDARTPPAPMRSGLLARARAVRSSSSASALEAYRQETERIAALLDTLTEADRDRATYNGLTIRELVLHLGVAERKLGDELLAPSVAQWDDALMRALTAQELAEQLETSLGEAVARWRSAVDRVVHLAPHATHRIAGSSVSDALLIRAFESWTHLDDIRHAMAEPESVPSTVVLQSMVDFSVRSAPWALALTGRSRERGAAELVLTGPVSGRFTIPLTPGLEDQDVLAVVTVDVVDWCKRFADRREQDVATTITGDVAVASDLIASAPCFAGL